MTGTVIYITGEAEADLVVGPGVGLVHRLCRRGNLKPNAVGGIIELRDEVPCQQNKRAVLSPTNVIDWARAEWLVGYIHFGKAVSMCHLGVPVISSS